MSLTLCVIARNEEAVLGRCLDSARGVVDQMVVVDTGSQDGTVRVARQRGAEVVSFPWCGDFAAARNASLELARGHYVLVLDADEFLLEEGRLALQRLMPKFDPPPELSQAAAIPAYSCLLQEFDAEKRPGMLARIVRLFPNHSTIRYEWPVHEQVETSLARSGHPILPCDVRIGHTGYCGTEKRREKQRRNLKILQEQIQQARRSDTGLHPMVFFLAGGAYLDLGEVQQAMQHYNLCATAVAADSDMGHAVVVRLSSCWRALDRWDKVAELTLGGPLSSCHTWHPELLVDRGWAILRGGVAPVSECQSWFEWALQSQVRPLLPACDFGAMRAEALLGLGQYWHGPGGNPALAVGILRAALGERQGNAVVEWASLRELYHAHGACLKTDSVA